MRYFLAFLSVMFMFGRVLAQNKITYHENEVADGYNYILSSPVDSASAKPLIIALHSRSATGNDLSRVDYFGTIDAIESGMEIDAYVLAPQATAPTWNVARIMQDVAWVISHYNIDINRIYAIGMSMGGNGAADLAAAYPDTIAAAIVLARRLTKGDVANLNKLPLWVIRGLNDREEAIAGTDRMIEEMRSFPDKAARLAYSRVKGLDHRQHERMLYMPCFYEWLMSHSLQDTNRPIHATMDLSPKLLEKSYKGLNLREGSSAKRKSIPLWLR